MVTQFSTLCILSRMGDKRRIYNLLLLSKGGVLSKVFFQIMPHVVQEIIRLNEIIPL